MSGTGGHTPEHLPRADEIAVFRDTCAAMATTFGVQIAGVEAKYARQAAQAAFAEVQRLEGLLSRFVADSEIAQINALRPGQSVRVSSETIECLELAAAVHNATGGAFDVCYATPGRRPDCPPLVLDPASHAIGVREAGVVVDLGGIGKGYALDRMRDILQTWHIGAALVHSGQSTVLAIGAPAGQPAWRVGLRHPRSDAADLPLLELRDAALSGSAQVLHGPHIRDPRTGEPVDDARAAWAIAPTAAIADALSTAFMVLSPTEIAAFCGRRSDVTAILLPSATARAAELQTFGAAVTLAPDPNRSR